MNLVSIYAEGIFSYTVEMYKKRYPHTAGVADKVIVDLGFRDKFASSFLSKVNGEDYYLFIINILHQQEIFDANLKLYDLHKYIVLYPTGAAHNRLYPSAGPKLRFCVLKFPKDYKYEARS